MKILLTGGHLTPALALIDYIQANHPQDEIVFVGRIYSQVKHQQISPEKKEVEQRGVRFVDLPAVRLSKNLSLWQKITLPLGLISSVTQSKKILKQENPDIVLTFGGYLGLPVAAAAKLSRIPIITHEQTRAAGFSNQLIAKFADAVALSYPDSKEYFPTQKTQLVGNPIRAQLLEKNNQPSWLKKRTKKPLLLIMGGNQGSQIINELISKILPTLTEDWQVIHLCGRSTPTLNYLEMLTSAKDELAQEQQENYLIQEWVDTADMGWLLHEATAAISRAGANTVNEIMALQLPTIFIPLPGSHHNEQLANAQYLEEKQAALILEQTSLSADTLNATLNYLQENLEKIKKNLEKLEVDTQAVNKLYRLIQHVLQKNPR